MSSSIDLGFISIHYYSIILLFAIFIGGSLVIKEGKRFNISRDFMFNLLFYTVLFGIIGARVYFVLFNLDYYLSKPLEIFMVWKGGLAIHGGIIFGLFTILFYCFKYKVNTLRILDIIVVGLILAQAIGRWGNFFNGEAHGPVTTLAYLQSLHLPEFIINGMYINGEYFIPTFLFESLWCFIGFIVLLIFRRRKYRKIGQTVCLYLIWYGAGRFFIEGLRTDSLLLFDFKIAQIVSILMILTGIVLYFILIKKGNKLDNLYNDYNKQEDILF